MYAVIRTGGKQYRVSEGDLVRVEKIEAEVGARLEFLDILMIGGQPKLRVGKPQVQGATVQAEVVEQGKYRKIVIFKHKRRKGYRRRQGHRQLFTGVKITSIEA